MFDNVQRSTLLAALRHYQLTVIDKGALSGEILALATDNGTHAALGSKGIDTIVQRLTSEPLRIAVVLTDGKVDQAVLEQYSAIPVEVFAVDFDTEDADPSKVTTIDEGAGQYDDAIVEKHSAQYNELHRWAGVFGTSPQVARTGRA